MSQSALPLGEIASPGKKLLRRLEKRPGWLWLGAVLTACAFVWLPRHAKIFERDVDLSGPWTTIIVFVATYVLYWLGDAMNDFVWKKKVAQKWDDRFTVGELQRIEGGGDWLSALWSLLGIKKGIKSVAGPRQRAQKWLGVSDGSYKLALRIAGVAGEDLDGGVYWPNEVAKVLRSLAIPIAVLGVVIALTSDWRYIFFLFVGFACFWGYIALKFTHMRRLYVAVDHLEERSQVRFSDGITNDRHAVRTFFLEDGPISIVLPLRKEVDTIAR
jgi:hypothetical protein